MQAPDHNAASRREPPPPAGPLPSHQPSTLAAGIVTTLTLPPLPPAREDQPDPPLLARLHRLRDTSMLYDMGRIDASGRVACTAILNELGWTPGRKFEALLAERAIVLRAAPQGRLSVPPKPSIIVPARARGPHRIKVGDQVLIAAAPEYGLVIVHPLTALDEMISSYHAGRMEDQAK